MNIRLTGKEKKAITAIISFLQGLKDCKEDEKEQYLLDNAFASRMILSFENIEPKDTYTVLSASVIQAMIPYLVANKDDSIDKIAEEFDKKTDEMMKDICANIMNKESNV